MERSASEVEWEDKGLHGRGGVFGRALVLADARGHAGAPPHPPTSFRCATLRGPLLLPRGEKGLRPGPGDFHRDGLPTPSRHRGAQASSIHARTSPGTNGPTFSRTLAW